MNFKNPKKTNITKNSEPTLKSLSEEISSLKKLISDQDILYHNTSREKYSEVEKMLNTYSEYYKNAEIDKNKVLWEAQNGIGMSCNPLAMFNYMLTNKNYAHYSHVWVINSPEEKNLLTEQYKKHKNVTFVKENDDDYLYALCSAGFIVDNVSMRSYFSKKEGQIVVNTWHSVTVKTLGFDTPDGPTHSRNMLRSFMMTDYLLSPNPFMTGIYKNSFKLEGVFEGKIIETGFPRVDLVINTPNRDLNDRLASRGVNIDPSKKTVLYAPTWRGADLSSVASNSDGLQDFIAKFSDELNSDEFQLLVKPHILTYRALEKGGHDLSGLVPPEVDANELLSKIDVLISDYSSIFYDFLPTGKPIFFFIPDKEEYDKERGVVLDYSEMPGPVSNDIDEIIFWITSDVSISTQYADNYSKTTNNACLYDDGKATLRVVSHIFPTLKNKKNKQNIKVVQLRSKKKKILIYGGGFEMNGVTTTLLALLKSIDYNKYDITLYVPVPKTKQQKKLMSWVPKEIRILIRFGYTAMTHLERQKIRIFLAGDFPDNSSLDSDITNMFKREHFRCFGDAKFDLMIDYSGYSMFWPMILKQSPTAKTIIWQHNELSRDFTNKKKRANTKSYFSLPTLEAMSTLYEEIDAVVACSESVFALNRKAMASPKTYEKFGFVTNMIDFDRVQQSLLNRYCFLEDFEDSFSDPPKGLRINTKSGGTRTLGFYADVSSTNRSGRLAKRSKIPLPHPQNINFVSIGRFSPEKNHIALFEAFAMFCDENPKARLYLIGDGAERENYESKLEDLGLKNRVYLTGSLKNPYGLAALCDCFILPSLYEGMGLVAIEARAMKLPMILTSFDAVSSVYFPDGQLIVETSPEALFEGLCAYRDGLISEPSSFDAEKYNLRGRTEFNNLLKNLLK